MNNRFLAFHQELVKILPDFRITTKQDSTLMKIIAKVLFFNSKFMTSFTTTIGQTVYFPVQDINQLDTDHAIEVLSHEFQHYYDSYRWNFGYYLLYLFPQILTIFSILSILAIWFGLGWLFCLAFLIFLAPWPAPGRALIEYRGYLMSLFVKNELMKEHEIDLEGRAILLEREVEHHQRQFVGMNYYFMWPFGLEKKLTEKSQKILDEEFSSKDVIYKRMKWALHKSHSLPTYEKKI